MTGISLAQSHELHFQGIYKLGHGQVNMLGFIRVLQILVYLRTIFMGFVLDASGPHDHTSNHVKAPL